MRHSHTHPHIYCLWLISYSDRLSSSMWLGKSKIFSLWSLIAQVMNLDFWSRFNKKIFLFTRILDINNLLKIDCANSFSHSEVCLWLCWLGWLPLLNRSIQFDIVLLYVCFWCLYFWSHIQKSMPRSILWRFSPKFSFRSFIVSGS